MAWRGEAGVWRGEGRGKAGQAVRLRGRGLGRRGRRGARPRGGRRGKASGGARARQASAAWPGRGGTAWPGEARHGAGEGMDIFRSVAGVPYLAHAPIMGRGAHADAAAARLFPYLYCLILDQNDCGIPGRRGRPSSALAARWCAQRRFLS